MHCKFNFVFTFLLLHIFCFGQHVEYNFGTGTGLFHYNSDKSDRMPLYYSVLNTPFITGLSQPHANDPRGEKSGFSFQFFTVIKKVTRHNLVWGIDAEFQSLQSRKKLLYVWYPKNDTTYNATGQCKLRNNYIDLFPYFGKRIINKKMYLDMMGGFELALGFLNNHEIDKAVITSIQQVVQADINSHNGLDFDGRFRLQSLLGYKRWGMSLGYSWGLTNMDGQRQSRQSHSRYVNIGIVYTLTHKRK